MLAKHKTLRTNNTKVVDQVVQKKASPVGNYTGESRAAWDVLTSAQKIDYLNSRLKEAVAEAVPRLIK